MLWTVCAHPRMWSVMTLAWHTSAGSFVFVEPTIQYKKQHGVVTVLPPKNNLRSHFHFGMEILEGQLKKHQVGQFAQVLWTVCAHRRMWSVTNYFLLNLTLSDILMATLNTTFSFIYMRDR